MSATVAVTRRFPGAIVAAAFALLWFAVAPPTPDLAAAVYRAGLFAQDGFQIYDSAWFGGHHLPGYSVLAPMLGAELGVRETGVVAAIASAIIFERLATARWGAAARPAVLWFAGATICDLMIGRITFGIGVAIGLGALLAVQKNRPLVGAGLALACSATSPVAGLFLVLALAAGWLAAPKRVSIALVAGAAGACVLALSFAFPEGGAQPYSVGGVVAALGSSAIVIWVAGRREPAIAYGAAIYAAIALISFVLPTPMGSNASRLGAAFAGPLLLAMVLARPQISRVRLAAVVAALTMCVVWQWTAPFREVARGIGDPSYQASFYRPMIGFLAADSGRAPVRIEVPFTRSHWEAVHIARHFALARGWQTQLDHKYNDLFFGKRLGAEQYRRWLSSNAVSYVAVPDVPLDPGGRLEARLIARGLPFLEPVFSTEDWKVYRVADPLPLVSDGRVTELQPQRFVLDDVAERSVLVRVRWTPYWVVETGGCAQRAGNWTRVESYSLGRVVVRARFAASRLVAPDRNCSTGTPGA